MKSLDFAVHGVLPHDRIVLLEFDATRRVFAVLLSDVAGSTGQAAGLMLCAFEDHLKAVPLAFLCHCSKILKVEKRGSATDFRGIDDLAFLFQFLDVLVEAQFRDRADGGGTYLECDPLASLRHVEFFGLEVGVESPLGLAIRV